MIFALGILFLLIALVIFVQEQPYNLIRRHKYFFLAEITIFKFLNE